MVYLGLETNGKRCEYVLGEVYGKVGDVVAVPLVSWVSS
jgi:hypothetical protein